MPRSRRSSTRTARRCAPRSAETDRMRIAVVVKGYPRLSETFIAQEILGLERRGLELLIVSLRQPTDGALHDVHREIRSPVLYLPEYLKDDPARVAAGRARAADDARLRPCRGGLRPRSRARPVGEPIPPLRSGLRARGRAARRRGAGLRALPPHAGERRPLRGDHAGDAVVLLGPRQGHLDLAGLGGVGEDRRCGLGGHLHRRQCGAARGGVRPPGEGPPRLPRPRFRPLPATGPTAGGT